MQLHCFGTAGYHPNEGRHTSAYFLPESNIALDAGSGFFRLEKHIQQDSIDILISHAHLDHVMGLTYLLDASFREKISRSESGAKKRRSTPFRTTFLIRYCFLHDLTLNGTPSRVVISGRFEACN